MKSSPCASLILILFTFLTKVLAGVAGCDSGEETIGPDRCEFAGITITDAQGNVISQDPSDWCSGGDTPFYIVMNPAFPNPAGSATNIRFAVSSQCSVRIKIVSSTCDTVRTLTEGLFDVTPGGHNVLWDLRDQSGDPLPQGIYRCYMLANSLECRGDVEIKFESAEVNP